MGKLELVQNFNSKAGTNSENIMIVYSSVRFEENQEPLRLVINYRYDDKGKKRDFSSCKVEVKLNTPGLGLVRCEVQVHDKNLALQFITENEPSGKIIDNAKDVLVKRLEEMNYSVQIQPCKVLTKQDGGFLSNDRQEVPGLFRLNVRV
ncbi:MAG: flagellar hook-length control protein FliK, partial [Eubacteriales bacterium]